MKLLTLSFVLFSFATSANNNVMISSVTTKAGAQRVVLTDRDSSKVLSNEPDVLVHSGVTPRLYPANSQPSLRIGTLALSSLYSPNDPELHEQIHWNARTDNRPAYNNILNSLQVRTPLRRGTFAVLDSGFFGHPELAYLDGYNMSQAGGKHRGEYFYIPKEFNTDATSRREGCSSHGTGVAGVTSAIRDNAVGVAGITDADLIAVRTMDCGMGRLSDTADALMWVSGEPVDDIRPPVATADVVNVSLGGLTDHCPRFMQEAMDVATDNGLLVVTAIGNDSKNASGFAPANCVGAISVAGAMLDGQLHYASNFGMEIDIVSLGEEVYSLTGDETVYGWWGHSSFATPIVSATLMNAVQEFGDVSIAEAKFFMSATATPMAPGFCDDSRNCGAGILDASAFRDALKGYKNGELVALRSAMHNTEFCDRTLYANDTDELSRLCALNEIVLPAYQGNRGDIRYDIIEYEKGAPMTADTGTAVLSLTNERTLVSTLDMTQYDYGIRMCTLERCFGDEVLPLLDRTTDTPEACKL